MDSSQTHLEQATHRHCHCHHQHQHHRHRHRHCHHYHHHHFFHPVSRSFPHHHHHHHHHHYHHRHVLPQCAFLNLISPHPTLGFCPNLINPPLQNTQLAASASPQHELPHSSHETQTLQEDSLEELEDEDDEEPVFVMTDEWREFFARSEARRREAKKLAKQQGKK